MDVPLQFAVLELLVVDGVGAARFELAHRDLGCRRIEAGRLGRFGERNVAHAAPFLGVDVIEDPLECKPFDRPIERVVAMDNASNGGWIMAGCGLPGFRVRHDAVSNADVYPEPGPRS